MINQCESSGLYLRFVKKKLKKLHHVLNQIRISLGVPLHDILTGFQNILEFCLHSPFIKKKTLPTTDHKTATHDVVAWSREAAVPQGHQSPHYAENPQ